MAVGDTDHCWKIFDMINSFNSCLSWTCLLVVGFFPPIAGRHWHAGKASPAVFVQLWLMPVCRFIRIMGTTDINASELKAVRRPRRLHT